MDAGKTADIIMDNQCVDENIDDDADGDNQSVGSEVSEKELLAKIGTNFNARFQTLIVPQRQTMTKFGWQCASLFLLIFILIFVVQWLIFPSIRAKDESCFAGMNSVSLNCAIVFGTLFASSLVISFNSKDAQLTCTISSCTVSLIAGAASLLQSFDIAPVSNIGGRIVVHSHWAAWLTCVPLLIFILGHVTQIRHDVVFFAMGSEFVVIFLGYLVEMIWCSWLKFFCFSLSFVMHLIIMICFVKLTLAFGELQGRHASVLNQTMVKALGISTVICWMAFPVLFLLHMMSTISDGTYIHSRACVDALSKVIFITLLNGLYSQGEVRRMEAMVKSLKSGNKLQAQFLRFVYHEIRNPFNTIMLGLNHLEDEEQLLPYRELIGMLRKAASAMLDVVDNVVELTQSHGLELVKESLDLRTVVLSAIASHSRLTDAKCIDVIQHFSKICPQHLLGDIAKLKKIFECLISNAIKFSPNYTTVRVSLKVVDVLPGTCKVQFSVKDSGPVISKLIEPLLFKPFAIVRPGDFNEDENRGAGLGLCFARHLADLMSAKLSFANNADVGATFHAIIDLETCPVEAAHSRVSFLKLKQAGLEIKRMSLFDATGSFYRGPKISTDSVVSKKNGARQIQGDRKLDEESRDKIAGGEMSTNKTSAQRLRKKSKDLAVKISESEFTTLQKNQCMTKESCNESMRGTRRSILKMTGRLHTGNSRRFDEVSSVENGFETPAFSENSERPDVAFEMSAVSKDYRREKSENQVISKPVYSGRKHEKIVPISQLGAPTQTIVQREDLAKSEYDNQTHCLNASDSYKNSVPPVSCIPNTSRGCQEATTSPPNLPFSEILIVDDVTSNLKLVNLILTKAGYVCDTASNGQEAVELASRHAYKLIIMDNVMPVMDGIEATRQISNFDKCVVIVGLTGNILQKDQEQFLQAGARLIIEKPANKARLLEVCHLFLPR